ncbi:MAG: Putative 1,2-phenylacetyl-CoA epoxidase, subunit D [Crocinitomicaceae bacterium]|nr:MAG: Putative 1,2-phenylacetyl-CoA epoxidase, subunit D [Crocinitomicaceae bacterium]
MASLEDIKKVISDIPDPEIPVISIKELGVLRNIFYQEDSLKVVITPTYSGCPAMDRFQKDIVEKLELLKVKSYEIKMQFDPAWTTDWITEEAKEKLRNYGIAPPAHKTKDKNILLEKKQRVECPRCKTKETELVSQFGSTACKAMYRCISCLEPFEYFKCL